jgi:hypothetical protein
LPGLVYILALERSGTTPLSFLASRFPGVVSLGEAERTLRRLADPRPFPVPTCSCGAATPDCPVWGPLYAARDGLQPLSTGARYTRLLNAVAAARGTQAIVVDSSKSLDVLRHLATAFPGRVKAVFMIMDVRNYLDGILRRADATESWHFLPKRHRGGPLGLIGRLLPLSWLYLIRWARHNAAMARFLEEGDIPDFRLGYEELCLDTEANRKALGVFLGIPEAAPQAAAPDHHVLMGNFTYLRADADKDIRYDMRWFHSRRTGPWLTLMTAPLMGMNRRLVYGNRIRNT